MCDNVAAWVGAGYRGSRKEGSGRGENGITTREAGTPTPPRAVASGWRKGGHALGSGGFASWSDGSAASYAAGCGKLISPLAGETRKRDSVAILQYLIVRQGAALVGIDGVEKIVDLVKVLGGHETKLQEGVRAELPSVDDAVFVLVDFLEYFLSHPAETVVVLLRPNKERAKRAREVRCGNDAEEHPDAADRPANVRARRVVSETNRCQCNDTHVECVYPRLRVASRCGANLVDTINAILHRRHSVRTRALLVRGVEDCAEGDKDCEDDEGDYQMLEFFEPPHKIDRFIFVLQLLLNLLDVLPEHLRVILEQGIHAVGHNRTDDEDRDDDVKCHEKLHPLSAHGDVSVANGGDDLDDHVNRGQRAPSLVIPSVDVANVDPE